jgi:hypothetical protein
VCRQFVLLCREVGLFEQALVAIDGSKFKAVNNRDKNFTPHKLKARQRQLDESIARYLADLDRADRDPALVPEERTEHLKEKLATVRPAARRGARRTGVTDRPRRTLDGHQRPRHGDGGLQRAGLGRHRASPGRGA